MGIVLIVSHICWEKQIHYSRYGEVTSYSGLYTMWDSFTPRKYKINLIRTLTYRCLCICSSSSLLQSALFDLKKTLLQNGYPRGVLCYNINHVLNRQKNKSVQPIATVPKIEKSSFYPIESRLYTLWAGTSCHRD